MGKFLKIIRYIAKTYKAIMGGCFSLPNHRYRDDLIPEQDVSSIGEHEKRLIFLSSHVNKSEFWGNRTEIIDSCLSCTTRRLILKGFGCIPVDDPVENKFWKLDAVNYLYSPIRIVLTENGFVIYFGEKSGILENFEMFLRQEITEGDFKEDLVRNNPNDYSEIWEILTSGSAFFAFYTLKR